MHPSNRLTVDDANAILVARGVTMAETSPGNNLAHAIAGIDDLLAESDDLSPEWRSVAEHDLAALHVLATIFAANGL